MVFKLLEKLKTEETQPDFNQLKDNSRDYWSERSKMDQQFGTNNSNQNPYAEVRSSQVSIQLRVYKTGETTLYTTNPTSKLINMSAAKGGGAPL